MPKKVTINKRAIARSVRISERHKQSKAKPPEEDPGETNENERNPKCKLRDVKNNKKKNDKKELSRLLFAKVVAEKPKTGTPPPSSVVQKKNATNTTNAPKVKNTDNKVFISPQKHVAKKPKPKENVIGPAPENKPAAEAGKEDLKNEIPNQNGIAVEPVNNENTLNVAYKKKTTQYLFNGEKIVINYPKIFGCEFDENLTLVPKNRMNYQDYLNTPDSTLRKYVLNNECNQQPWNGNLIYGNNNKNNPANTGPIVFGHTKAMLNENPFAIVEASSSSGNDSNLTENDECVKIMAALCGYVSLEEKESAPKKSTEIWKNDEFNSNEKLLIKYITEQFVKLAEASNYLMKTRENLKHIIQFQETKEFKEPKNDKVQEIIIKCENGSIYKIKETDIHSKVEEIKIKEEELIILEADLKKELHDYIKSLPNQLKTKLLVAMESNSDQIISSETGTLQLQQILQEDQDNGYAITMECIKKRNINLSRKQKKNKRKKMAKKRRNTAYLTFPLVRLTNGTEVLRENLNISNTTIDLPDRDEDANETFEIHFVDPDEANQENANVFQTTPNDEMEQLNALVANSNGMLPNIISSRIESNSANSEGEDNLLEEAAKMNLTQDEIFFLIHMINDRTNFNIEQRETHFKKYFSLTENNPKNVFKAVRNDSENRKKSVIKFVNNNFPFVDEGKDDSSESDCSEYDSDVEVTENESEESDSEVIEENVRVIREVNPEVQERMNQYQNKYFDINIAAVNQLIPEDPLNEKQYEKYEKNRNELHEQFADLFQMNCIKI